MGTFWRSLCYTLRVPIFTLINALLLRDLPVRQPECLVRLSPIRHLG
jgi:hypothetical protein